MSLATTFGADLVLQGGDVPLQTISADFRKRARKVCDRLSKPSKRLSSAVLFVAKKYHLKVSHNTADYGFTLMTLAACNMSPKERSRVGRSLAQRLAIDMNIERKWVRWAWTWATNWFLCVGRLQLTGLPIVNINAAAGDIAANNVWAAFTSIPVHRNVLALLPVIIRRYGYNSPEAAIIFARVWLLDSLANFQKF